MSWEAWAVLVSLVGVVGSYIGLFLTWRHSRKSREMAEEALKIEKRREAREREERRREDEERRKANFTAQIVAGSKGKMIEVENLGPATARNFRVFVDGEPAEEAEWVRSSRAPEPGGKVDPHDPPLTLPLIVVDTGPRQHTVKVEWDDDFASDRSYEVILPV